MKRTKQKIRDERIDGEVSRVYRVGYYILSVGILIDLLWKMVSGTPDTFPRLESAVFLAGNLTCTVLLARRGLMDDNSAYAEADVFPLRHYALLSLGVGAATGVLFALAMGLFGGWWQGLRWAYRLAAGAVTAGVMFVLTGGLLLLSYYCTFRAARARRARAAAQDEAAD